MGAHNRGSTLIARWSFLQFRQRGQNLFAVDRGLDSYEDLAHHALGIDQESISIGDFHAVHLAQRAVGRRDFMVWVGQQFERQAFLRTEFLVRNDGILTDTENYGVLLI